MDQELGPVNTNKTQIIMKKQIYITPYLNRRAKYTVQTLSESGSFSQPEGTDVLYASKKTDIERILWEWREDHRGVGADPDSAYLYAWSGDLDDVTDKYPDWHAFIGRRGGFNLVKVG